METNKRTRMAEYRRNAEKQRLVGDCEDLLPFAWRTPPEVTGRRKSKVLHMLETQEAERNAPPAPSKHK